MTTGFFRWSPQIRASADIDYRTRSVRFGDGYEQVAREGMNSKSQQWEQSFTGGEKYISDIADFLDRNGGSRAFSWKPPLSQTGLYRCDSYKITAAGGNNYTMITTFRQAFQP